MGHSVTALDIIAALALVGGSMVLAWGVLWRRDAHDARVALATAQGRAEAYRVELIGCPWGRLSATILTRADAWSHDQRRAILTHANDCRECARRYRDATNAPTGAKGTP